MHRFVVPSALCVVGLVVGVVVSRPATRASTHEEAAKVPTDAASLLEAASPVQPLPPAPTLDPARVELGARLFAEPRLSADATVSCASCHDIASGGADRERVSKGVHGRLGTMNAPTVLNAGLNFRQFWDGRAASLQEQVDGPLLNPDEMGASWDATLAFLRGDPIYSRAFAKAYPDGVTADNVRDAIVAFERSATTPGCRFDRYLLGDTKAIDDEEREGYHLFLELGCVRCHRGPNVGGTSFETFGIASSYFAEHGESKADLGRYNVTGKERDRYKFKVPTLRNVSRTAPYLHDGSIATLGETVQVMARYQLGQPLDAKECAAIVAFLKTLDGDLPKGR